MKSYFVVRHEYFHPGTEEYRRCVSISRNESSAWTTLASFSTYEDAEDFAQAWLKEGDYAYVRGTL